MSPPQLACSNTKPRARQRRRRVAGGVSDPSVVRNRGPTMMVSLFLLSAACFVGTAASSPALAAESVADATVRRDLSEETPSSGYLRPVDGPEGEGSAEAEQGSWERMHVIRRLHGHHAAGVRQELSNLEERMERYQTGFNADPNHRLEYLNHPFDPDFRRRRRRIQDGDGQTDEGVNSTAPEKEDDGPFKPMRIVFETGALDSMRDSSNAAKIDWIKSEILPKTAEFWSKALGVVPVSGKLRISAGELESRSYCGDSEFTEVPDEHIQSGVPDADLVLYVSGTPSSRFCPQRTLAVAVPCNFDQFDRPTAGAINVCLDQISLASDGSASDAVVQDYVDVCIHETAHVLGHSSNSYRFFWDSETGEPRTSRPFSTRTVTCVDGTERSLILPDENTMVFGEVSGRRYASIVTPKVQQVARNQFDCQTLEGGQLENQPTRSESCTGDHWDEMLYYPEALSGVISPTTNVLSSLTLALFEDSGWYKANYTMSRMSPWGLGAGCDFVYSKCLQPGDGDPVVPDHGKGFFCNKPQEKACSSELSHKLACTVMDYYFFVPQNLPPEENQYFPDQPTIGGPRQADYCPVFGSPYSNKASEELDCTISSNGGGAFNTYNEAYGPDSKCIPSSSGEGRCYRTACVLDIMALRINVGGKWYTCDYDYKRIDISLEDGAFPHTLTCPRLSQACPDLFCPFNCAGRGICRYDNVVNGTVRPMCECFDKSDTSPACSDSLIPDGGFLDDSSGLFDNLEENFFDPLIAVFVDHPDKWTTASYAWAAGLSTICIILLLCICSSFFPSKPKPKPKRRRRRPRKY